MDQPQYVVAAAAERATGRLQVECWLGGQRAGVGAGNDFATASRASAEHVLRQLEGRQQARRLSAHASAAAGAPAADPGSDGGTGAAVAGSAGAKAELNELVHACPQLGPLAFPVEEDRGPRAGVRYVVCATVGGRRLGVGSGRSLKAASTEAAAAALLVLKAELQRS